MSESSNPGQELEQFVRGYVSALLWADTLTAEGQHDEGDTADEDHLTKATWLQIIRDCAAFVAGNSADLREYAERRVIDPSEGTVWDYAGHDFALTRNGHGAGFWDRDLGELGERLSSSARTFGELDLQIMDDGSVAVA